MDIDDYSFFLGLNYGIDDRWSLGLSVPARLLEVESRSTGQRIRSDGFGDAELRGTYRILAGDGKSKPELQASVGVALPTGRTNVKDSTGLRAVDTAQPGRGTVDPILSVSLLHPVGQDWRLLAGASARLGLYENSHDYEYGDSYGILLGASYTLSRVDLFTQADWNHVERDRRNDVHVIGTGGETINFTLGVQVWATDTLSFRLQDRILIYHDVRETQQLPEHTLSVVTVLRF